MLLISIISDLILHSWLFTEKDFSGTAFSGIAFNAVQLKKNIVTTNIFINKLKHYFISCFFIKFLWISNISSTAIALKSTLKSLKYAFNPVFFILSTEKSFQKFPKNKGYDAISESFALNLIIYVPLTNK